MNEDFIPLELAVKLKEKGFPLKYKLETKSQSTKYKKAVVLPNIYEVLKWLRKEKEIDIVIYPIDACTIFMGGEKYILSVYINRKRDYKLLHHDNKDKYVEWEDAAIAGIEYVLDNNLI